VNCEATSFSFSLFFYLFSFLYFFKRGLQGGDYFFFSFRFFLFFALSFSEPLSAQNIKMRRVSQPDASAKFEKKIS